MHQSRTEMKDKQNNGETLKIYTRFIPCTHQEYFDQNKDGPQLRGIRRPTCVCHMVI